MTHGQWGMIHMAGLGDFINDASTEQLHIMQVEYEEQFGDPIVHLWCRDRSGNKRWVEVEGHRPSFYIHRDAFSKRVVNHDWVQSVDDGYQSIHDEPLVRVETRLPWHVGGKQDKKGLREYFEQTWEADVFFTSRFLIDTGIKTHLEVDTTQTWGGQSVKGDYRVNVDDISPVEDPPWRATPRVVTVDIEVQAPDGFPSPDDAEQPVTAITAHDNHTEEYTVWVLRHEGWDYSDTEIQNLAIENRPDPIDVGDEQFGVNIEEVRVFEGEDRLLHDFNSWVEQQSPDLLGGWNSSTTDNGRPFDYPYLINRCQSLNVMNYRDWSPLGQVWDGNWGPGGKGIGFFDMLKGYKKTQWQKPKGGYSLENITTKELPMGEGKLDIEGIDAAWRDDPGTFLEYNIRDVQAVVGIDEAAGVMDLFQNIRALAGVQFENTHNNIDLLDVFILRYAHEMDVALPTNEEPDESWYYGAHVFEPKIGRHENVVYPDVWSMYPNMIRNCNMSPETMIGTKDDLEDSEYTEDDCRWAFIDTRQPNVKKEDDPNYEKVYFLKPSIKEGFMSSVVDDLMGMKDHYDGTPLYGAVKRIVNSCFTPDTEVLTPEGIKQITEFEVGDEVYAMDHETGEMEVKEVISLVEKPDYNGELIDINNGRMHHTVTPDHDMAVRRHRHTDDWEVTTAGDLNTYTQYEVRTDWDYEGGDGIDEYPLYQYSDVVYIEPEDHGRVFDRKAPCDVERHATGTYNGYEVSAETYEEHEEELRELADRVLCRCDGRERRVPAYIDGSVFTQLGVWYTTEGHVSSTTSERVVISQHNSEGRKCIENALERANLQYRKRDSGFAITSEVLSTCFADLFGDGSFNKQFPRHFRDRLSPQQREIAAVTFVLGDGRWENDSKTNARYTTTCKKLRDDVMALFTECGSISRYQQYTSQAGTEGWRIYWRRDAEHQFRMSRSGSSTTMEEYEEKHGESGVYCITVEGKHTIIAGRNGKMSTTRQCYGVFGDSDSYGKGYRLFDWRIAEGITLAGRRLIQDSADKFVDSLNDIKDERGYEGRNARLVGGDTDSVMSSVPYMSGDTREEQQEIVDIALDAANRVNSWYDEWATETFNLTEGDHYCELEIESYAPKLFIPKGVTKEKAKKRYGEIIAWDEGEWHDPPEFSVTGIDIVRSDRAVATRDISRDVLNTILRVEDRGEARDEVYDIISERVEAIKNGDEPNSYIARPKGMSKQPSEYGSLTQTPMPTYRGAKYANQNFPWEQMDAGSKPQLLYIERVRGDWPRTYTAETKEDGRQVDAIACEHPDEVPDEFVVDTDKMIEKVVEDPLTPILAAMGWDFDEALADSTQVGIGDFM